jgi:VCBS repeat-containing protein
VSGHCRITPDGSPSGLVSELAGDLAPAIGRIETLVGVCTVSRSGVSPVQLGIGDLVGPSDIIETSAGGRLSIRFADGTAFTLSDNGRMALKDYVDDTTSALFDVSRGTFSFIAGKMAEASRLCIQTPFASIRARRNGGGTGMLSLISLFFAAFEEAHAASSDVAFLDDGKITSKDLGEFGIVELLIKATPTSPEQHKFIDDPGETIVIRAFGSSVSVDSVTNSIAQMAQYQAAQQEALHTFSVGLQQGQGPTGNGAGGSSTDPSLLNPLTPPPIPISAPGDTGAPPHVIGGPTFNQTNGAPDSGPLVLPPPPPPPPAPGLVVEREHDTGDPAPDVTTGTLSGPGISAGAPTFVWSGGPLTPGDQSNLAAVSTLTFTGSGPNDFTFHIPDQVVDFLAAGETLTVTYNVTIAGGATEQAIITVFGTQDTPKLVADLSGPHTTAELSNDKNDSTLDQTAPGTLHFSDVDLNDIHTVSSSVVSATWSGGGALPSGLSTVLANALSFTMHDSTHAVLGSVDFTFSAADKNFDFLAEGETLTVTYNVTVMDNFGATSTQPVNISITGSEDAPVITSGAQSGSATEIGDNLAGENVDIHHSSGTVTFNDVDLSDIETQSITNTQVSAVLAHGYALTAAQQNTLVNAFGIDPATHSNVTGDGTIGWHYDIADSALDFLGADDVVTLTYTVQIADGHGGTASQNVIITVHGTEDAPTITSGLQAGSATEIGDLQPGENTDIHHSSGAVAFNDVDQIGRASCRERV